MLAVGTMHVVLSASGAYAGLPCSSFAAATDVAVVPKVSIGIAIVIDFCKLMLCKLMRIRAHESRSKLLAQRTANWNVLEGWKGAALHGFIAPRHPCA